MKFPEKYRRVLPPFTTEPGKNGRFILTTVDSKFHKVELNVIATNGEGWDHASVTVIGLDRCPTWEEMSFVKSHFWEKEECVVQFHPPESEYVNNHKYCLHLWKKHGYEFPTPPPVLIGLKKANIVDKPTNKVASLANIDDVVNYLFPRFAGFEKTPPFKKGEDFFAAFCHSQMSGGIGMQMRNELDLWSVDSPLHKHFVQEHKCQHPDEMSDLILRRIYKKMGGLVLLLLLFAGFASFGQGFSLQPGQSISTKVYLDSGIRVTGSFGQLTQEVYRDTTLFDETDGYVHQDKVVHYTISKKGVRKNKRGETVDTLFVYDHRSFLREAASDSGEKYRQLYKKACNKKDIINMVWYGTKIDYYNGRWDAISECLYYDFPKEFSHKK